MTRPIRNLNDLRYEKKALAKQLKKDVPNVALKGVNSLIKTRTQNSKSNQNSTSQLIENGLYFLSAKADERFKFNSTTKSILGILIGILVPVIAQKIENFSFRKKKK